jgi:serine/threonine-protein kinase
MEGIADFVFLRRLGEGPHGQVQLARPPARLAIADEYVAVKVLMGFTSREAFYRVAREFGVIAALRSDRVVQLFDVGLDDGRMYVAMRYHPHGSLSEPRKSLSRRERLIAVSRAARAAHDLHEAGTAHRAIKLSNVLLDEAGGCLSDPGTAQLLRPGLTVAGFGTRNDTVAQNELEYIDPRLLRGRHVGRGSDIWALGVTLHIALTGHGLYPAIPSADPLVAVMMHVKATPELDPDLGAADRAVIARAVRLNRSHPYRTANELADDIEALTGAR